MTTPAISRWSAGGDPVDVAHPVAADAQGTDATSLRDSASQTFAVQLGELS